MADSKRYYWLKLKDDFFEEDAIEWLEEQENGKEYCLFYLKLCLKSVKSDGILIRNVGNMLIPYDIKKLAEITKTDVDTAIVAMELLKKIGLVEVMSDGALYLSQLKTMVGSECKSAERVRKFRAKSSQPLQCNKNVTTEKEKEIETEKENKIKESNLALVDLNFDFESAWNSTFEIYPKKTGAVSAKQAWMDKLLEVIGNNRKDVARLIYKATKAYLSDYQENNPEDTKYRYIPKYAEWLKEDCDYWIRVMEQSERSNDS